MIFVGSVECSEGIFLSEADHERFVTYIKKNIEVCKEKPERKLKELDSIDNSYLMYTVSKVYEYVYLRYSNVA